MNKNNEQASDPLTLSVIMSVALIVIMAISGVVWGLRLETRMERRDAMCEDVRDRIAAGILPVTEERTNRLANDIRVLNSDVDELKKRCDAGCVKK